MKMLDVPHRLSIANIEKAAQTIDPVFLNSPQFICQPLAERIGAHLVLKVETNNPIRCFKGRGADFFFAELEEHDPGVAIICASAGNFGQAIAYCGKKRGLRVIVYAARSANALKVERMKALGATVELFGDDFDSAKLEAKRIASKTGAVMVEDGKAASIAEGAGTIGLELLSIKERLDAILVPLGNGALLTGIARIVKEKSPQTRVIAIQAEGAPAMVESWLKGEVIVKEGVNTICDGIAVRLPIPEAVEDMNGLVDEAIFVSDQSVEKSMKMLFQTAGLLAEPSGAVGLAAILENQERFAGQKLSTIICGSNLTPEQINKWLIT
jgi:threonine dehydratase